MSDKENADKQSVIQNQNPPGNSQGMQHGQLVILSSLTESLMRVLEEFHNQLQTVIIPQSNQPNLHSSSMGEAFNAVELLFKVLVYENDLCDKYKLQLSKLQTIYVKVAAADSSFYHQDSHPARELLSHLVQAAKNNGDRDESPDQIFIAVDSILQHADDNSNIFIELLDKFKKTGKGADKVLDHCRQSSASLGQDIDIVVKAFINSTIQSNLANDLSVSIKGFIQGPWQAYMYWIAMNLGVHGEAWEKAKTSLMDLIALSDPHRAWEPEKRSQVFNEVSQEVEAAFNAIQLSQGERAQWLNDTINILEQASQPQSSSIVSFSQERLKDKASKANAMVGKPELTSPEASKGLPKPEEALQNTPQIKEPDVPQEGQSTQQAQAAAFDESDCEEIELTAPSPFGNSK